MRGDMSRELRTDGTLQPDSSSSSSSPHSTSSHDEEILEVTGAGFMPKPIYNFSIPDVIKHEPRVERNENRFENSDALIRRKRAHQNFRDNVAFDENSVSVRNKRRRRSITAAVAVENILEEANNDDDCHRPPVIDLTDIDSHDEYQSAHSDSEINDVPITETRYVIMCLPSVILSGNIMFSKIFLKQPSLVKFKFIMRKILSKLKSSVVL